MRDRTLRRQLQEDFDVELDISGGFGQSIDDPIIIDQKCRDYTGTEYMVIRLIYSALDRKYKTVGQTLISHKNKKIDQVKVAVEGDEDNYYNFYFDITAHLKKS